MKKQKKHKTRSLSDYFDGHQTPQPIQTPQPPPMPTPLPLDKDWQEDVFIMECMDQICDENADGYTQTLALEECRLRWRNLDK
jgi:hypothetical protein